MVQKYICHSLMILFLLCCSIPYIYAQNFKTLGMKDG